MKEREVLHSGQEPVFYVLNVGVVGWGWEVKIEKPQVSELIWSKPLCLWMRKSAPGKVS